MRIRLLSDLHLEFGSIEIQGNKNEILILAGDIHTGKNGLIFIAEMCLKFRHVIYVLGNHEFYKEDIGVIKEFWSNVELPNFHFLDDSFVIIDDVKFVGGTLWTDLNNQDYFAMAKAKSNLNDFNSIRICNHSKKFSPHQSVALHNKTVKFITDTLEQDDMDTIVVTHHLPLLELINDKFKNAGDLNYAYASDLTKIIEKYDHLKLWCFGHTHDSVDADILGTRFMCNPRGYTPNHLNENFKSDKFIAFK